MFKNSPYRSYLVRLWRHNPQGQWLASVQEVRTGATQHFAQPEKLWAYLQAEMTGECVPPEPEAAMSSRSVTEGR